MATKSYKLHSYIVRYHNFGESAVCELRVNVPRSEIRSYANTLRQKYVFVFVAKIDYTL